MPRILILVFLLIAFSAPAFSDEPVAATKPAAANAAPEIPLDQPNMDHAELLSWAALAVSEAMTFNYTDYQQRPQQSSSHFTQHGWATFIAVQQKSGMIDAVRAQNRLVSARPKEPPVIVQEGKFSGIYRWAVSMPLAIIYKDSPAGRADTMQLNLIINRVTPAENSNGVAIDDFRDGDNFIYLSTTQKGDFDGEVTPLDFDYPPNEFGGVGMAWLQQANGMRVNALYTGMPAQRAGIKIGDILTEVNGKAITGMTFNDVLNLVRGTPGTRVGLTFMRENTKRMMKFNLVRGTISEGYAQHDQVYYKEALKVSRAQAAKGVPAAQNALGILYESGLGVTRDYRQAAKWYRKAAEQGNAKAQYNLGMLYKKGNGVSRDDAEAVKWLRKAAEQYNSRAQYSLAKFFADGTGIKQDYAAAYFWAALSGKRCRHLVDCEDGMQRVSEFKAHLTDEQISAQDAAAKEWGKKWNLVHAEPKPAQLLVGKRRLSDLPLDQPNLNKDELSACVAAAATRVTTFGFDDWEETFSNSQKDFTPEGWKSFQDSLMKSGLLNGIVQYQQVLASIPIGAPMIQQDEVKDGAYQWTVNLTLLQTIRAGNKKQTRYVPVTMIIVRTPAAKNPRGIGISTWAEAG